jgi:hypothetical protein
VRAVNIWAATELNALTADQQMIKCEKGPKSSGHHRRATSANSKICLAFAAYRDLVGRHPSARTGTPVQSDMVPERNHKIVIQIEVISDKRFTSRFEKYADINVGSFESLVARWRVVRSVARVHRVWGGDTVHDVPVQAG